MGHCTLTRHKVFKELESLSHWAVFNIFLLCADRLASERCIEITGVEFGSFGPIFITLHILPLVANDVFHVHLHLNITKLAQVILDVLASNSWGLVLLGLRTGMVRRGNTLL